jgi:outer membrane lipoprotein-sorting protein
MRLGVLLVLAGFLMISTARGEDPGRPVTGEAKAAFLATWGERLRGMRSLHMVFTQEKHLRMLRQALVAQGELWLKGEALLYVLTNTTGEKELTVRLDKQTVRTHYPLLNTVEVIDLQTTGALPQSLPFWQADPEVLTRDYEVDLSQAAGLYTLHLVPKDAKAPLQEMRLVLRDFQPQELVQVEKNGTRILMHITTFTMNPEINETQLELHVPAGTKVTHPLQ